MLNLHLGSIRTLNNAYIYFSLLDSYLDGISEQRYRIKQIASDHGKLRDQLFNSDSTHNDSAKFYEMQKNLFREIHVFFWWWRPVFVVLWKGECIDKKKKIYTECLVKILGESFSNQVNKYKDLVGTFCDVRHDLEHILERIHNKNYDLGNLSEGQGRREFQICGKSIDISDNALDFVDSLCLSINQWLHDSL